MLVICNGMIRSGSTLQYNLARGMAESCDLGHGEGFFSDRQANNDLDKLVVWQKDDRYHVIKMHNICPLVETGQTEGILTLYIYRDLRDVAVSVKNAFHFRGARLFTALDKAVSTFSEIQKLPNVLMQRYEDVMQNVPDAAWDLSKFLSIDISKQDMSTVVNSCTITKALENTKSLRKRFSTALMVLLRRVGFSVTAYDNKTLLHPNHISETTGAIGVWRSQLEETELNTINDKFATWLKEQGYIT